MSILQIYRIIVLKKDFVRLYSFVFLRKLFRVAVFISVESELHNVCNSVFYYFTHESSAR